MGVQTLRKDQIGIIKVLYLFNVNSNSHHFITVSFLVLRSIKMFSVGMQVMYKNIKSEKLYSIGLKAH